MKDKKELKEDLFEDIKELEDRFTMMISDLCDIKGMAQARINYIYHRKALWEIQDKIENLLK